MDSSCTPHPPDCGSVPAPLSCSEGARLESSPPVSGSGCGSHPSELSQSEPFPWELRLGRWEDVLGDVERVDALISDPPYSERTHRGHDEGKHVGASHRRRVQRRFTGYEPWGEDDVTRFVASWTDRCAGWFIAMTDHVLVPSYEQALLEAGWYVFAPVPVIIRGSRFRAMGDGPPCWAVWLVIARPRSRRFFAWGALPGGYVGPPERSMLRVGGKPEWLCRALIRDYTRLGDLVCDPCAGGGTTLLAAAMEGRRAIGAEMDQDCYELARQRLTDGYTPDLLAAYTPTSIPTAQQETLVDWLDGEVTT